MPELPEVETMRRCVAPAVGCRIRRIIRPRSALQSIAIRPTWPSLRVGVRGQTICAIRRLGKRIVLDLENGFSVVLEPRMTGLVLLADPPNHSHLRLIFELERDSEKQYPTTLLFWDQRGLGVARLVATEQLATDLGPTRLGPDALLITLAELRGRLASCRRPIKVALLDQKLLAGVGNLYASEILHRARIHPAAECRRLRRADWVRLHAAMGEVLELAVSHQGSTLRDGTYRIARDTPGDFQALHRVYQRHGQLCLQCQRSEIVRVVQAQRSTFYCPRCQRARG